MPLFETTKKYPTGQDKLLSDAFTYIKKIDCHQEKELCTKKEIRYYPTWVLANGKKLEGVQTVSQLAAATGCNQPF